MSGQLSYCHYIHTSINQTRCKRVPAYARRTATRIDVLHEYVRWLSARDILAAKILFTYRVWGATRMGDRSVDVDTTALGEVKPEAIQRVTEDALGLYCSGLYTVDKAHYEVGADIWSSIEGTEAMDREIEIPISRVVRRASRMAFDECATYFTCLRDSLRNVLLDIDTFVEERKLLKVMSSGEDWRMWQQCRAGATTRSSLTNDKTHLTEQLSRDVSHRTAIEPSREAEPSAQKIEPRPARSQVHEQVQEIGHSISR